MKVLRISLVYVLPVLYWNVDQLHFIVTSFEYIRGYNLDYHTYRQKHSDVFIRLLSTWHKIKWKLSIFGEHDQEPVYLFQAPLISLLEFMFRIPLDYTVPVSGLEKHAT